MDLPPPSALSLLHLQNLWRNYDDIQCNYGSLSNIINHWGDYGPVLQQYAGPGHWNDPVKKLRDTEYFILVDRQICGLADCA